MINIIKGAPYLKRTAKYRSKNHAKIWTDFIASNVTSIWPDLIALKFYPESILLNSSIEISSNSDANLTLVLEFGENLLNNLLQYPWSNKKTTISSATEALAFLKVTEFVAGKIIGLMSIGQNLTLEVAPLFQIYLQVVNLKQHRYILKDIFLKV